MSLNRLKKRAARSRKTKGDDQTILVKASQAHREGRLDQAERGYLKVLKNKPGWGQVLNALGTVYLDKSQPDKAEQAFEKAASLKPPHLSACYNLATLKQQGGDHQAASKIYAKILKEQPEYGQVWNNLGIAYKEIGELDQVIHCFEQAVKYAPEMAEAWNNLGVAQDERNLVEESIISYQKAIEIHPDYTSAHFNLGSSLHKLKRFKEAEIHFRKILEIRPDDEPARFMLQSIGAISNTPEAAPAEHVRRIFDQCAGTFEKTLVDDLEYKTPALLFNIVRPHLKGGSRILDLGCGTGLGSALYRPYASHLTGVDISSKMLEQAGLKNVYDQLELFDLLKDWSFPEQFDLIYSSDVFVYLGNLHKVFGSIASYLCDGGLVAFSVERLADNSLDYQLHSGGRYAHSQNYLVNCMERHGLKLLDAVPAAIRKQSGNEVEGLLVVAEKTG